MTTNRALGRTSAPPEGMADELPPTSPPASYGRDWRSVVSALRLDSLGAVYVLLGIVVVFSFWAPETFPTIQTAKTILNQNAITALAALAVTVALVSETFDLSIGNTIGLTSVVVAYLLTTAGLSVAAAIALTLLLAVVIGLVNAFLAVTLGLSSFITTIATGSLMAAAVIGITGQQPIVGPELFGPFKNVAQLSVGGIATPVVVMAAVAVAIWWLFEHTVTGRRLYAVGFNLSAATLAGISSSRLRFISLIVCSVIGGIAGIMITSQLSAGSPEVGPSYLLDAFAAAFLGSTQFRPGRFNVQGTVLAVFLLGTGKTGLALVGAPVWAGSTFSGIVLILALVVGHAGQGQLVRQRRAVPSAAGGK